VLGHVADVDAGGRDNLSAPSVRAAVRASVTRAARPHGGYLVADTSFGYTNNCRYLGGYQRVDIPVVRNWLLDCTADLACPTKD
jgi:hypothetical protein